MTYIASKCPYCDNGKQITANRTSWLIPLSGHREEIIEYLTDTSESCEFCSYLELYVNKKHASSHYRWDHQKSTLVNWALDKLEKQILV
ncbi:hypothetical protein [Nitrosopumilus ureiphilus]|uniref:Uncharacterized protein n=1 Tax=Nitrosopumilus ureiphilus TaxID=1470067 RepID=A0A7D5RBY4_9ARCH|nr:hypothetical protein [Nitrosopumilus ureiphilus]QLH07382.1 hypothetical protein C5F50_10105 [Nitrosopumilus ureiphilus]